MWTHSYRGGWIHGYCDKDVVHTQSPDGKHLGYFKSYRAGQLSIARILK